MEPPYSFSTCPPALYCTITDTMDERSFDAASPPGGLDQLETQSYTARIDRMDPIPILSAFNIRSVVGIRDSACVMFSVTDPP